MLATWNPSTLGAGVGGWHGWIDLSSVDKAIALLSSYGIHVVNETFSFVKRWARLSVHQKRKRTPVAVVVIPFILSEEVGEVVDAIHSVQSGYDYFLSTLSCWSC